MIDTHVNVNTNIDIDIDNRRAVPLRAAAETDVRGLGAGDRGRQQHIIVAC